MLVMAKVLLQKKNFFVSTKYFCRNKSLVTTKIILLLEKFSHAMYIFVATKDVLCRNKHMFVATNMCLSRQNFCRDKNDTCGSSRQ